MTDLTVNLYNKSSVCLFKSFTLLRTDNLPFAFNATSLICRVQSKLDVITRLFTLSIQVSPKTSGEELFRHLLEKMMSFDFLALNVTLHLSAHEKS